jgi:hypothetical protein
MNRMTPRSTRRALAGLAALAGAFVALSNAPAAGAENVAPQITLGPTTILNGLAVVSGHVSDESSGSQLTVNGRPLDVTAGGSFAGVVDLNGQSVLSLSLDDPVSGESSTVTISLTTNLVGLGGLLSPEALAALEQAAVSVIEPVDGFVSVGDGPIEVSGSVGNGGQLAGLSVNGVDALSTLKPDGSCVVPVPGTTKEISVLMVDKQGATLETTYRTTRSSSTVSAADADGVRIAKIRYFTKGVKKTKRVRVVVTVRDRQNRLIHGAVVKLRSPRTDRILGRAFVQSTNLNGKVTFVLRVRREAFGKRNRFVAMASTPNATVSKRTAVRLPRMRSATRR